VLGHVVEGAHEDVVAAAADGIEGIGGGTGLAPGGLQLINLCVGAWCVGMGAWVGGA
jgi:hypothetical protein